MKKGAKKVLLSLAFVLGLVLCFSLAQGPIAFAQEQAGIIPSAADLDCPILIKANAKAFNSKKGFIETINSDQAQQAGISNSEMMRAILGCAVKTGRIRLYMLPFFITYLTQFVLTLAGLGSVVMVAYGGFQYVVGGIADDKESGKKTIRNALIGLVISLSAWIIVNFVQIALTS